MNYSVNDLYNSYRDLMVTRNRETIKYEEERKRQFLFQTIGKIGTASMILLTPVGGLLNEATKNIYKVAMSPYNRFERAMKKNAKALYSKNATLNSAILLPALEGGRKFSSDYFNQFRKAEMKFISKSSKLEQARQRGNRDITVFLTGNVKNKYFGNPEAIVEMTSSYINAIKQAITTNNEVFLKGIPGDLVEFARNLNVDYLRLPGSGFYNSFIRANRLNPDDVADAYRDVTIQSRNKNIASLANKAKTLRYVAVPPDSLFEGNNFDTSFMLWVKYIRDIRNVEQNVNSENFNKSLNILEAQYKNKVLTKKNYNRNIRREINKTFRNVTSIDRNMVRSINSAYDYRSQYIVSSILVGNEQTKKEAISLYNRTIEDTIKMNKKPYLNQLLRELKRMTDTVMPDDRKLFFNDRFLTLMGNVGSIATSFLRNQVNGTNIDNRWLHLNEYDLNAVGQLFSTFMTYEKVLTPAGSKKRIVIRTPNSAVPLYYLDIDNLLDDRYLSANKDKYINKILIPKFERFYSRKLFEIATNAIDDRGNLHLTPNSPAWRLAYEQIKLIRQMDSVNHVVRISNNDVVNYIRAAVNFYKTQTFEIQFGNVTVPFAATSPNDILSNRRGVYSFTGISKINKGHLTGPLGHFQESVVAPGVGDINVRPPTDMQLNSFASLLNSKIHNSLSNLLELAAKGNGLDQTQLTELYDRTFNSLIESYGIMVENMVTNVNKSLRVFKTAEQIKTTSGFTKTLEEQLIEIDTTLNNISKYPTQSVSINDSYYKSLTVMQSALMNLQKLRNSKQMVDTTALYDVFNQFLALGNVTLQASNRTLSSITINNGTPEGIVGTSPGSKTPGIKTSAYSSVNTHSRNLFITPEELGHKSPAQIRGFGIVVVKDNSMSNMAYGISEGSILLTKYGRDIVTKEQPYYTVKKSIELTPEEYNGFKNRFAIRKTADNNEYNVELLDFINSRINSGRFDTIESLDEIPVSTDQSGNVLLIAEGKAKLSNKNIRIDKYFYNPLYNPQLTDVVNPTNPNAMVNRGWLINFQQNNALLFPEQFVNKISKRALPYTSIVQDSIRKPMQLSTGLFNTLMEIVTDKLSRANATSFPGDVRQTTINLYGSLFRNIFHLSANEMEEIVDDITMINVHGRPSFQIRLKISDPVVLESRYGLGTKFNNFYKALYADALSLGTQNGSTPFIDNIVNVTNATIDRYYHRNAQVIHLTREDIITDLSHKNSNLDQPVIVPTDISLVYKYKNQIAFLADLSPTITTEEKYAIYSNQVEKNWSMVRSKKLKGAKLNQFNMLLSSINSPNYFKYIMGHLSDNLVYSERMQDNFIMFMSNNVIEDNIRNRRVIKGLPTNIVQPINLIQNIFDKTADIHNKISVSVNNSTSLRYPKSVTSASSQNESAELNRSSIEFVNAFIQRATENVAENYREFNTIDGKNIISIADEAINAQQRTSNEFFNAIEQTFGKEDIANTFSFLDMTSIQHNERRLLLGANNWRFSGYVPLMPSYSNRTITTVTNGYVANQQLNSLYLKQTRMLLLSASRTQLINEIERLKNIEAPTAEQIRNLSRYEAVLTHLDASIEATIRSLATEYSDGLSGKFGIPAISYKVTSQASIIPATQFIDPSGFTKTLDKKTLDNLNSFEQYMLNKLTRQSSADSLTELERTSARNYLTNKINYFRNSSLGAKTPSNGLNEQTASLLLNILDASTMPYNLNDVPISKLMEQQMMREMIYQPLNKVYISEGALRKHTTTALDAYLDSLGLNSTKNNPSLTKLVDFYIKYAKQRGVLGIVSREPEHSTKAQKATIFEIGATGDMNIESIQPSYAFGKIMHQDFDSDVMKTFISATELLKKMVDPNAVEKIDISKMDYNQFEKIMLAAGRNDEVVRGNLEDVIYNDIKNYAFIPATADKKAIYSPILDTYVLMTKDRDKEIRSVSVKDYIRDLLITHAGYDPSDQELDTKTQELIQKTIKNLGAESNTIAEHLSDARIALGIFDNNRTAEEAETIRNKIYNDILLQIGVNPNDIRNGANSRTIYNQMMQTVRNVVNGSLSEEAFQAYTNTKVIPPKVTLKMITRLMTARNITTDVFSIDAVDAFYDTINNTAIDSKHGFLNFSNGILNKLKQLGTALNSTDKQKADHVTKILQDITNGDYEITMLDSRFNMENNVKNNIIDYINTNRLSSRGTDARLVAGQELTLRDFSDFYKGVINEGTRRLNAGEQGAININAGGMSIPLADAIRIQGGLEHVKKTISKPFKNIENGSTLIDTIDGNTDKFLSLLLQTEKRLVNTEQIQKTIRMEQGQLSLYPDQILKYLDNEIDNITNPTIKNPNMTIPWINSILQFLNNASKGTNVNLLDVFEEGKKELINMDKIFPIKSGAPALLSGVLLGTSVISLINGGALSPIQSLNNNSSFLNYFDYGLHQESNSLHKYKSRVQLIKPEIEFKIAKRKEYSDQANVAFINKKTNMYIKGSPMDAFGRQQTNNFYSSNG